MNTAREQIPKSRAARLEIVKAISAGAESASTIAPRIGRTRQDVTYHLNELARRGVIRDVGEGPRRGRFPERRFALNGPVDAAANDINADFVAPPPRLPTSLAEAVEARLPLAALGPRCPACDRDGGRPERRGRLGFLECVLCARVWRPRGHRAIGLVALAAEALAADRRALERWGMMGERARDRYFARRPPRFDAVGEQLTFVFRDV